MSLPPPPESYLYVADLMDRIQEAEDYLDACDNDIWPCATPEQLEELEQNLRGTFTEWLVKHRKRPTFWNVIKAECFKNPNPQQQEEE